MCQVTMVAIPEMEVMYFVGLAIFGLVIGSFLNVVIWRLPHMLNVRWNSCATEKTVITDYEKSLTLSKPASHCPGCHAELELKHLIPVFSFLFLRGRCGYCGAKISRRYPVVELLGMGIAVVLAASFGWSTHLLPALLMGWSLICLAFIDLECRILPDELTYGLLWFGLLVNSFGMFVSPDAAILGAVAGYGMFWLLFWGFLLATGKEGLGYGDMKFLAALGAWFGWQSLPALVLMASLFGLIVNLFLLGRRKIRRNEPVPFGPWMALAGGVYLIAFPQELFTKYIF